MTDKKFICPLIGKPCIEDGTIVNGELHACRFWIKVVGKHPQTGADVDQCDCAFSWIPMLLIDNTQKQRETGAAVESFRNEMIKAQGDSNMILTSLINPNSVRLIKDNG
jgi:hypothetical protein